MRKLCAKPHYYFFSKKPAKNKMPNKELAAQHKAKGNAALAAKDFEKAIAEYTEVSGQELDKNTRLFVPSI